MINGMPIFIMHISIQKMCPDLINNTHNQLVECCLYNPKASYSCTNLQPLKLQLIAHSFFFPFKGVTEVPFLCLQLRAQMGDHVAYMSDVPCLYASFPDKAWSHHEQFDSETDHTPQAVHDTLGKPGHKTSASQKKMDRQMLIKITPGKSAFLKL